MPYRLPALCRLLCAVVPALTLAPALAAQPDDDLSPEQSRLDGPPPMGGPGGPPPGRGPMMGPDRKLVKRFDADGDHRLNDAERAAAREFVKQDRARGGPGEDGGPGRRPPGFGPPGGGGGPGGRGVEPPGPGARVAPNDVTPVSASVGLYDPHVLRTIFLDFAAADWEDELSDFVRTDVEVPATMTVDGVEYRGVGVGFRGASSLMMVPKGSKRSLNISVDAGQSGRRLLGVRTLNLLNSNGDPSFMRGALYARIAEGLGVPAPRVNFVRVVINGESWGVYASAEQFNKDLLARVFPGSEGEGARWKVPGSPNGRGGLEYLGEDVEPYRGRYEIKTTDEEASWEALIDLCRTLNETPLDELEAALAGKLDVEGVLWFLALDAALVNSDGYWTRASDYSLYRDVRGVFHIIPHDVNETFSTGGGPGRGGRFRGPPVGADGGPADPTRRVAPRDGGPAPFHGGVRLDPLVGLDDRSKPLRSRLLAVRTLRARYLEHVRTIAEHWLDWTALGPIVDEYRLLIAEEVESDTKKLHSYEAFEREWAASPVLATPPDEPPARPRRVGLRQFVEQRREYLLSHEAITPPAKP